mmetsp:Transcript_19981/g.40384  ORF Transcript_19981/g.40384 Transcript_19981/m.40384 type:complete len:93 (-) Transcript_19981:217-495(-)
MTSSLFLTPKTRSSITAVQQLTDSKTKPAIGSAIALIPHADATKTSITQLTPTRIAAVTRDTHKNTTEANMNSRTMKHPTPQVDASRALKAT